MLLYFFLVTILYIPTKLVMLLIAHKFGKFSYDDFSAAGFAYNSDKKIFYSTKNAWQKEFGYCNLYDVGAPFFQMIIDTEPVRFYYNNKNWLLTFWKGQYGITTGAEIGIYCTTQKKVNKKTIYFPVNDDEMLDMGFTLYKKGKVITKVEAKHWWLAIFKIGMFSKPKDLTMDIKITFSNREMLEAFLKAFKKLKHKSKEYNVVDNTFYFTFKKPRAHKVWTRIWISDKIRQSINRKNVKVYNQYLADSIDDSKSGKNKIKLNKWIPDIFKNIPDKKEEIKQNKESNVIFLNDMVYSDLKKDNS